VRKKNGCGVGVYALSARVGVKVVSGLLRNTHYKARERKNILRGRRYRKRCLSATTLSSRKRDEGGEIREREPASRRGVFTKNFQLQRKNLVGLGVAKIARGYYKGNGG